MNDIHPLTDPVKFIALSPLERDILFGLVALICLLVIFFIFKIRSRKFSDLLSGRSDKQTAAFKIDLIHLESYLEAEEFDLFVEQGDDFVKRFYGKLMNKNLKSYSNQELLTIVRSSSKVSHSLYSKLESFLHLTHVHRFGNKKIDYSTASAITFLLRGMVP